MPRPLTPARSSPQLWTIGLSALLIALGFGRHRSHRAPARGSRAGEPEADRGRSADTPSDIPAPGWKDIILRVSEAFPRTASCWSLPGSRFTRFFDFPGYCRPDLDLWPFRRSGHRRQPAGYGGQRRPGGAIQVLRDEMTRLASRGGTALGWFSDQPRISLWTTNSGVSAIFDALNIVYEEKEKRGLIKYYRLP